jgi:hypothetical protein
VTLHALGRMYLDFALVQPLKYRLKFGTTWPDSAIHDDLKRDARLS